MNKGGFIRIEDRVYRVLDVRGDNEVLLIDCKKKEMPKWIPVTGYEELIPETDTDSDSDKDCFTSEQVAVIHKRFSYIAGALPVIGDEKKRTKALHNASELYHVSIQTIRKYLCEYLAAGDISSLAPADRNRIDRELSKDEKIMRWALNKFYYTKNKNSVQTAYVMMLKERYSDPEGNLLDEYPSIHQFRYFYRKTK
ncbi:MAG: hypothetical protein IIY80_04270, partial [Aeriscardovia sp.]|nr:hypothetical protein [Aeriscardovia sp.]